MNKIFCSIGILGGVYWFVLHTFFSPGWGPPGTAAYEHYELFNRLWTPGLIAILLGFVGFYRSYYPSLARGQRGSLMALLIGLGLMVVGNWAEFWLFSEQSYTTGVGRNVSWMMFLIGMLILIISSVVVGISSLGNGRIPKWAALLLIGFGPLVFVGLSQEISLLTSGMFSLVTVVVGLLGLRTGPDLHLSGQPAYSEA